MPHELLEIVNDISGIMSARRQTLTAPDTEIGIQIDRIAAAVIPEFGWTNSDAGVTIDTLVFVDLDDKIESFFLCLTVIHKVITFSPISNESIRRQTSGRFPEPQQSRH
jgi:hypothetical protein